MISEALANYSISLHDDINSQAEFLNEEKESVFVSQMGILLDDYGETDTVIECVHQSHGLKVDGYCFDEELNYLILITSYFIDETDLSKARINREFPAKTAVDSPNFLCVESFPLRKSSLSIHGKSSWIKE